MNKTYRTMWNRAPGTVVVTGALLCAASLGAQAQSLYWDLNGSSSGAGMPLGGTWNTTSANWSTSANGTGATGAWVPNRTAVFSAGTNLPSAYTVTVAAGGITGLNGITSRFGSPRLTGGTLAFNPSARIEAGSLSSMSIASAITGTHLELQGLLTLSGRIDLGGALTESPSTTQSATLSGNQVTVGALSTSRGYFRIADGARVTSPITRFNSTNNPQVLIAGAGTVVNSGVTTVGDGARGVVHIDGASMNASSLSIGVGGNGANGTLDVRNGGTAASTSPVLVGATSGATGTLALNGGTLSAPGVVLGAAASSAGSLNLSNGGVLAVGSLSAGRAGARDAGTIVSATVNGGELRATQSNAAFVSGFVNNEFNLAGPLTLDSNGFDIGIASPMRGVGNLVKQGAGTLTLMGANTYNGATDVARGTLRAGAANSLSAASAASVAAGATLDLAGFDQTLRALANAGTVSLVGAAPGTRLTVTGAYVGHNGTLRLSTALGDSASASDRLVLDGAGASASGRTTVQVGNLGGLGAQTSGNGIELIAARNGATTTAQTTRDAFALANGHVDAGAFEYRLHAADANGAGESWYLRSTTTAAPLPEEPLRLQAAGDAAPVVAYRQEVPLFAALPSQLRQADRAMLGNLHQRVGDDDLVSTAASAEGGERRAWGRVIATRNHSRQDGTVSPESEGTLSGFQAGTDLFAQGHWRAGVYVGQLDGDMATRGFASGTWGPVGSNDLQGRYLGAYATWQQPDTGFYVDSVLQAGRHRVEVEPLANSRARTKGSSVAASVELGRAFALGEAGRWTLEPQLQLVHQNLSLDDAQIGGARVQSATDKVWIARAGLRLKGVLPTAAGTLQPYGRINLYRTGTGSDSARFVGPAASTDIATSLGGSAAEAAAGLTLAVSPTTTLYGEVGRVVDTGGAERQSSEVRGSLGVRVRW